MPTLVFLPHEQICPEGKTIQVEPGITICDAALQNGIPIEHACEKSCACTTCHNDAYSIVHIHNPLKLVSRSENLSLSIALIYQYSVLPIVVV